MTHLLYWLLLVVAPLGSPDVDDAVRRVYENTPYQRELPGVEEQAVETRTPTSRRPLDSESSWTAEDGTVSVLGGILKALFWIVIAAAAVFLIVWLVRELPQRGWRRAESAAPAAEAEEDGLRLLPEELAAQGQYGAAIHALLVELIAQLGEKVPPAWTSREVLRRFRWPEPSREPLRHLVGRVEQIRFGGATAREGDYRHSVEDAGRVRDALGRAAG